MWRLILALKLEAQQFIWKLEIEFSVLYTWKPLFSSCLAACPTPCFTSQAGTIQSSNQKKSRGVSFTWTPLVIQVCIYVSHIDEMIPTFWLKNKVKTLVPNRFFYY